ncbi:MAG: histidinol-phosphatase HisJ family protein [Clostridiales bacterium]|nr:histidinol-phosphatase HisJ family protein [Clostridiales bacterium]
MRDLHAHTTFCDGKNTPEEMVLAAIEKGLTTFGLVIHSFAPFDTEVNPKQENVWAFQREMQTLKEKFRGKINLLCGIEQDVETPDQTKGFDYVIAGVHYLKVGGTYYPVDHTAAKVRQAIKEGFHGDPLAFAEAYFSRLSDSVIETGADVLAHPDLLLKFNEVDPIFDTSHPRYQKAMLSAVEKLLKTGVSFEVNVGAITRGYRTTPYPEPQMLNYLKKMGAPLVLGSDAHSINGIANGFSQWEELLK